MYLQPARSNDNLLLSTDEIKISIGIHTSDVAGSNMAITDKTLFRFSGCAFKISKCYGVFSMRDNLSIFSELYMNTRKQSSDRSDLIGSWQIERNGAKFNQAVGLEQGKLHTP